MKQYHELLRKIMGEGVDKGDRTGTGTRSIFGHQMRFNLQDGFPLVTSKLTSFRLIAKELLWFLGGRCNKLDLQAENVHIWDEWSAPNPKEPGDMGPIYGVQWRSWALPNGGREEAVDQIADVIHRIRTNPNDRRMIVSAWNVADIPDMALPPCHVMFQFYVADGKLSCQLYQRSSDCFLGVPFNIASYALLTHMIAHVCDLDVGEFIWTSGDTHIYSNHFDQVEEILSRTPRSLPQLRINPVCGNTVDDFVFEDFQIDGYDPYPTIKAAVAV